jgi:hypothetical protein
VEDVVNVREIKGDHLFNGLISLRKELGAYLTYN